MNYIAQNDKALLQADIESGGGGGGGFVHRDSRESPVPSVKQQSRMFIAKLYGTSVDSPENGVSSMTNSVDGNAPSVEKVDANEGKDDVEEKKVVKQKQKPASAKKPPRPPKAPSLDAADKKLIREIAELARLKRARIERMKALRKNKACKASSSNGGSALGFLLTIIFGLLILLQGIPSRGRPVDFHGSRVQGVAVDATNLASARFLGYPPVAANNLNGPVSSSPNSLEQATGLDPNELPRFPR